MDALTSPKITVGVHCQKLRTKGMYINAVVDRRRGGALRQVRRHLVLVRDDADRIRAGRRARSRGFVLRRPLLLQALS